MNNDNTKSALNLHQFAGEFIFQSTENVLMGGQNIPKGYVNATQILKAATKETGSRKAWDKYFQSKSTQEYLTELALSIGYVIISTAQKCALPQPQGFQVSVQPLVIVINGGKQDEHGTWVHPEVAIHLSQWASPKMAVWANRTLRLILENQFKPLTEEAEEAFSKLQDAWWELRGLTKQSFWFIAEKIHWYYQQNPRVENFPGQNYSEVFNALNLGIFGKKASQIKTELGITKGNLNRDHFGKKSLHRIDMIQRLAEAQIEQGKTPVDAVKAAIAMFNYPPIDYKD